MKQSHEEVEEGGIQTISERCGSELPKKRLMKVRVGIDGDGIDGVREVLDRAHYCRLNLPCEAGFEVCVERRWAKARCDPSAVGHCSYPRPAPQKRQTPQPSD